MVLASGITAGEWQIVSGTPDYEGWHAGASIMIAGDWKILSSNDNRFIAQSPGIAEYALEACGGA